MREQNLQEKLILFCRQYFQKAANFEKGAKFAGEANFRTILQISQRVVHFDYATFLDVANFSDAIFSDSANFRMLMQHFQIKLIF